MDWEEAARQFRKQRPNKKPTADLPVDNTLKNAIEKRNREDAARAKVLAADFKKFMREHGAAAQKILAESHRQRVRFVEVYDDRQQVIAFYFLDSKGLQCSEKGKIKTTTVEQVSKMAVNFGVIDFREYTLSVFVTDEINGIINFGLKAKE